MLDAVVDRTRLREANGRRVFRAGGADGGAGGPDVSIVIVTHGGAAFTAMCLESVLADLDGPRFQAFTQDSAGGLLGSPMHNPFGRLKLVSMRDIAETN